MKNLKKRMPKIIAAACSLVLLLSAVLMPTAVNAALPRPSSVPTPSGSMYTTSYENGVYTLDLDAAYLGSLLENGDISKEDIKEKLPDSIYALLVDRDATAVKEIVYDLAIKAAEEYLGSVTGESSATPKARGASSRAAQSRASVPANVSDLLSGGNLLDKIPDDLVINADNLDTILTLVQTAIDNNVVTVDQLNEMIKPDELRQVLGVPNTAEGKAPTIEDYLTGDYNEKIVEKAEEKAAANESLVGQIKKEALDEDKVNNFQISKKDLAIMVLRSMKDEALVLIALYQDEIIDLMSRVEAIQINGVTIYGADAKFSVTAMEEAVLSAIPSIDGISANLGVEGDYADFTSVTISVLTTENVWHEYTARIRFAGTREDRAVLKSYVDKIARFGSYHYDTATGAFILDINLPDGFLPLCVSAVDETKLPDNLKNKLGDVATLDFSDSANTPAIVNAIIHNLTLNDFVDFLECVDVYQVAPGKMATFEAKTGLNSNHVETARKYLIRMVDKAYAMADQYEKYGTDKIVDALDSKRLDQLTYTGNGTFTISKSASLDLMNLAEKVSTLPDRDLSDEVDKLGDLAGRVEDKVEDKVNDKFGDDTVDKVEGKVEDKIEDLTGQDITVDVSRMIEKIFGLPYDQVFEKYPALADKVRNLPDYMDRVLTDTTLTHTVTVNVNFEDLYRVEYIREGEAVHFDYLPEGYEIANIDADWAPNGWADANGLALSVMPAADVQVAALRTVTFVTYWEENGVKTLNGSESFNYTELTDTSSIAPTENTKPGFGDWVWSYDWQTEGLPIDKDITIEGVSSLETIIRTFTFAFNGKTYTIEISGTIRDSLLTLLNASEGAKEMLADYPGYSLEWYYRVPTKSRAITAPAGYTLLDATYALPADGNIEITAIPVANEYDVTFKDEDGNILGTGTFTADDARADGLATNPFDAALLKAHILTLAPEITETAGYTYEWTVPALTADALADIEVVLKTELVEYTAVFNVAGEKVGEIKFNVENYTTVMAKDNWPEIETAGYQWPAEVPVLEAKDMVINAELINYTASFTVDGKEIGTLTFNAENFTTALAKTEWPELTDYVGLYKWPDAIAEATTFKAANFEVKAIAIDYTATFVAGDKVIDTLTFNCENFYDQFAAANLPDINEVGYEVNKWADVPAKFEPEDVTIHAIAIEYTAVFTVAGQKVGEIKFTVENFATELAKEKWPEIKTAGYQWPDADYTKAFEAKDITIEAVAIEYTAVFNVAGQKVGEIKFTVENYTTEMAKEKWPEIKTAGYEWPATVPALEAKDMVIDAIATEYTAVFNVAGQKVGEIKFTVENYATVMAKEKWPEIKTAGYEWPATVPAFEAKNITINAIATEYTAVFNVAGQKVGEIKFTVENYATVMAKEKWPTIEKLGYEWPAEVPAFEAKDITINALLITYVADFGYINGDAWVSVGTVSFTAENYAETMLDASKLPALPEIEGYTVTAWKVPATFEEAVAALEGGKLLVEPELTENPPLETEPVDTETEPVDTVPVDTAVPTESETLVDDDDKKGGFPWWILLIILILIGILLILFFSRKEDPEAAPAEEEPEEEPVAEPEPEPVVEVVEEVEEEKEPLFVPFGEEEPEEEPEEFEIVASVSADNVDDMMTDTVAQHLIETAVGAGEGKMGIINVGQLSEAFAPGETVSLAALKAKGMVDENVGRLKILASGVLDRPLVVKADAFSVQAIKMITLTGGHVVKLSINK